MKEEERLMPERQEVTGMIPVRLTEKRIKEGAPFETPSFWFILLASHHRAGSLLSYLVLSIDVDVILLSLSITMS